MRIAISNPCIELWFLLHFQDQSAFVERQLVQSLSRRLLGCDKALSEPALESLREGFAGAKQRAIALDAKHKGDGSAPHSNPSSTVWSLVDSIINSASDRPSG